MTFFIGIDAGGTKTTAALANETTELARVTGGTIKLSRDGEANAKAVLHEVLEQLCNSAGVRLLDITQACLGLAGARVPENKAWSTIALKKLTGSDPIVIEDVEIALEAAFPGKSGALVISGTGSHVMARNDKQVTHAGGYGRLFSDEGSGEWIGQQAIRRALAGHNFVTNSPLLEAIMRDWQCETFVDVVAASDEMPLRNFSALVPLVCRLASEGEATAYSILEDAGHELASLVKTTFSRLGDNILDVAYTGSILENIPQVRKAMISRLPNVKVLDRIIDPIDGALWLARNARSAQVCPS